MSKTKAYVVGGGIFGALAAKALAAKGVNVTIFDSQEKYSGSRPAACLMKPSWMSGLDYKPGIELLDSLVGVSTIPFKVGPLKVDCLWTKPSTLLDLSKFAVVHSKVLSVEDGVVNTEANSFTDGIVVVAAGVWSFDLLPNPERFPEMRRLCGTAVLSDIVVKPTINVYAPYRQAVWFNRDENEAWFGDGTAIVAKNFDRSHIDRTKNRSIEMARFYDIRSVSGQRPYVKTSSPGFFKKLGNNLFVSTGGAKNGTILAALQTLELLKSV